MNHKKVMIIGQPGSLILPNHQAISKLPGGAETSIHRAAIINKRFTGVAMGISKRDRSITWLELYKEAAQNYRYFLTWRQLLIAGYIAVCSGLIKLTVETVDNNLILSSVYLAMGSIIGLFFFIFEQRNTQLYRAAFEKCMLLEGNKVGFYNHVRLTVYGNMHTYIINILYISSAIIFGLCSFVCLNFYLYQIIIYPLIAGK